MPISPGDQLQIRAILLGVDRLAERVIRKLTLDVTANLIETTPVDTGWARANWVPQIGSPFIADLEGVEPSAALAASGRNRQQAATASIPGYRLNRGSVFVTNNVPYILPLNDGTSAQAPRGFVQRAIADAVTQLGPVA